MPAKKLSVQTRREIQGSGESVRSLARRLGVSPATVCKWRKRTTSEEAPRAHKNARSTVLTAGEEQLTSLFRCQTLLPLDDCLYAMRLAIPTLTRSSMHRCFKRHGLTPLSMLQETLGLPEAAMTHEHGHFHLSAINVQLADEKGTMFIALDRVTKYAHAGLYPLNNTSSLKDFIVSLVSHSPFPVHTIISYIELYQKLYDLGGCADGKTGHVLTLYHSSQGDINGCADILDRISTANVNRTEHLLRQMPVIVENGYDFDLLSTVILTRTERYNQAAKLKSLGGIVPNSLAAC